MDPLDAFYKQLDPEHFDQIATKRRFDK